MKRCPRTGFPAARSAAGCTTPRSRCRPADACARRFYAPAQDGPSCAEAADTLLEALAQIELENGVRVRGGALEAGRAEKAPLRAAARYAAAFSPADTAPKMQAAETGLEVKA